VPTPAIADGQIMVLTDHMVNVEAEGLVAPTTVVPVRPATGRLLRNILMLGGGQLASWAFGILWLVFVPRVLGPAPIGEFVIALAITAVLGNLINQGAGTLLTREIARDHQRAPQLVAGTLLMRLACGLPAFGLMLIYVRLLHFGPEQSLIIWLATGVMLSASLSGAVQSAFTGLERMEYLAYASLVGNGLISVASIALVLLGGRIVALLQLDLTLTLLILALNLYWARGVFKIAWRSGAVVIPYILRAGFSYWFGGLFFTTYLWIDSVLLSALTPVTVIGYYGVTVQLFTAILMVASVLATAWFPRLAAAFVEGPEQLRRVGRPAVETAVVLSLPIAAGAALVSAPLINLLYGPPFSGAAPVLALLAITVVPTFFNMLGYQVLLAAGRQVAWIKIVAVATFLNVGANLVLIPYFQARGNGAIGAAIALLSTEVFEAIGAMALLPWLLNRGLLSRLARTALATALMSLVVYAVAPVGIVVEIASGIVAFAFVGLLLRLPTAEELAGLRGLRGRLGAKLRFGGAPA
jgi:O-antigen/teichoic acid export membrane protein